MAVREAVLNNNLSKDSPEAPLKAKKSEVLGMQKIEVIGERMLNYLENLVAMLGGNPFAFYPVDIVGDWNAPEGLQHVGLKFHNLRGEVDNRRFLLEALCPSEIVEAFIAGKECAPSGDRFEYGSRSGEPDGYGVEICENKLILVKYVPTSQSPAPNGTRKILIAEKAIA